MKFFTEDGKYVGSIPDREFEESKNSVMPMRLHLKLAKQPKVILASSGYRLMFYSCLVGVLSALLTALWYMVEFGNGYYASLHYLGLLYDLNLHMYPLFSTLFLFTLAVLVREHFLFLTAFCIHGVSYLCTCLQFLSGKYPGRFGMAFEFIALVCTCVAFMELSGNFNRNFGVWLFCLAGFRFLLLFTENLNIPQLVMAQFASAVCFVLEAKWFDYLGVRVRRKYKRENL